MPGALVRITIAAALALLVTPAAHAAEYSFGVMMRAGLDGAGDWEVSLGPSAGAPSATMHVNPYWRDDDDQRFEVIYNAATSQAQVRIHRNSNPNSSYSEVTWNVAGVVPLAPGATWTLPASSFYVLAHPKPGETGVAVNSLTLDSGVNVISPINATSIEAYQNANSGPVTQTQPSAITFYTDTNNGGSWTLSGNISWRGLAGNNNGNGVTYATRSQIQFAFLATASDNAIPEPGTLALTGAALLLAGIVGLARRPA